MTDWTEHDGYTLRNALRNHPELGDCDLVDVCARAAAHIADLEARVAGLEQSDLEAFVVERLPYQFDDGTGDDASAEECVEYAADELRELRKRIAALEAERAEVARLREQSPDCVVETDYHTVADRLERGEHEKGPGK